jgi:hypothetical protein
MIEPLTYEPTNIPNRVYQPSFVRFRHRYKGPRESLKINQEIGLYYTDLNQSLLRLDAVDAELDDQTQYLVSGGGGSDDVDYTNADAETETYYVNGLEELAARTARLRNRVKSLERNY